MYEVQQHLVLVVMEHDIGESAALIKRFNEQMCWLYYLPCCIIECEKASISIIVVRLVQ